MIFYVNVLYSLQKRETALLLVGVTVPSIQEEERNICSLVGNVKVLELAKKKPKFSCH